MHDRSVQADRKGDIATPNGMVALRETMTQDTCILNIIFERIGALLRALLQAWRQASDRALALNLATVGAGTGGLRVQRSYCQFEESDESGGRMNESSSQRNEQPADEGVANSVSGAWFDRSNMLIELEQAGKPRPLADELDAMGELIRSWRSYHGRPRSEFAREIGMPVDALLFLETGTGLPEDITRGQLQRLVQLFEHDKLGDRFKLLVERYVEKVNAAALPREEDESSVGHRSNMQMDEVKHRRTKLP